MLEGRAGEVDVTEARALQLYKAALALVEANGTFISVGLTTFREHRGNGLIIHYLPSTGHLDVWHRHKVLAVNHFKGILKVAHFTPGEWENTLLAAAPLRD